MKHKIQAESKIERIHRLNIQNWTTNPRITANDLLRLKRVKDLIFSDLQRVVDEQEHHK